MQFPISIGLRRSRFLVGILAVSAVLAIAMVMALPWSIGAQAGVCLFVLFVASIALRQLGPTLSEIRLDESGGIQIVLVGKNEPVAATLLPGATVHPWLTVARLKTDDGRVVLLAVAVDSLKPADFRRLRVFLRWRAEFSAEESDVP